MQEPQPWPFVDLATWRLWRDHLDTLEVPNVATLKREADAELARILRCQEGRWEPKRPAPANGSSAEAQQKYLHASPEVKERLSRTVESGPVGALVKRANQFALSTAS